MMFLPDDQANMNAKQILNMFDSSDESYQVQIKLKKYSSFKAWMKDTFKKVALQDIAHYGCIGGVSSLTYYYETTAFYRQFCEEIWTILNSDMENAGYKNVFELIATFDGAKEVANQMQFENLLVWYAAERIASTLLEEIETNE